jgi:hypothetical protein
VASLSIKTGFFSKKKWLQNWGSAATKKIGVQIGVRTSFQNLNLASLCYRSVARVPNKMSQSLSISKREREKKKEKWYSGVSCAQMVSTSTANHRLTNRTHKYGHYA